jgi:hypothetical protein
VLLATTVGLGKAIQTLRPALDSKPESKKAAKQGLRFVHWLISCMECLLVNHVQQTSASPVPDEVQPVLDRKQQ